MEKIILGYYPSWFHKSYPHTAILYEHLSIINHAFLALNPDATLKVEEDFVYPEMNEAAHSHAVKVLVSVGGWTKSHHFDTITANPELRKKLIHSLITFCIDNHYDGIDLDWEYCRSEQEKLNYVTLVRELRETLDKDAYTKGFLLSSAVGKVVHAWENAPAMAEFEDYIGVMTYDYSGPWENIASFNAPMRQPNIEQTNYLKQGYYKGVVEDMNDYITAFKENKKKLLLGIPFYGDRWKAEGLYKPALTAHQIGYNEIFPQIDPKKAQWDDVAECPYYVKDHQTLFVYDNEESIKRKCQFVIDNELSGIIIWSLGHDYYRGRSLLLESLSHSFQAKKL